MEISKCREPPRRLRGDASIRPDTPSVDDAIRQRAYQLWEQDRRPHGRDLDYWLKAEQEVTSKKAAPKRKAAGTATKATAKKTATTKKTAGTAKKTTPRTTKQPTTK